MSDYSTADIGSLLGMNNTTAINSTSRKNNTDLDMTDFLQLMIVQLQSQTMDDTMDTSEMMNQLVQMQMITAITNMTETNIMTYANSMVGKVVTVGVSDGTNLEERVIRVMGTGTYNGNQVIFGSDGEMYQLKQIMAMGQLPNEDGTYDDIDEVLGGTTKPTPPTDTTKPTEPTPPTDTTEPDEKPDGDGEVGDVENKVPVEDPNAPENTDTPEGGADDKVNAGEGRIR